MIFLEGNYDAIDKELDRIGAVPLARFPCLIPPRRTASGQPQQRVPVAQFDFRLWTLSPCPEQPLGSVGQNDEQRTRVQPAIDPVEHTLETARHQPREQPGPASPALAGGGEMGSPDRRMHVHRRAYAALGKVRQCPTRPTLPVRKRQAPARALRDGR